MKLLVVSYKECWSGRPGEHLTVGGFPHQMEALSALFTETRLMILARDSEPPAGARPLTGHRLSVDPLPEPAGTGMARKLALLLWLPRHFRRLWQAVRWADAVHALVPGDLGTIGLLAALALRKPVWVRHCGTWGNRATAADRFLAWLLPRVASGSTVVTATGGGESPPCPENAAVSWIFSTALSHDEIAELTPAAPWRPDHTLRLIHVGRLTEGKNAAAAIRAVSEIRQGYPRVHFDIVGGGPIHQQLRHLVSELKLENHVTLHGNVAHDDVLRLLQRCHLFLFPTRVAEGFPKAVLEAMACGVPVLVPRVSVLPHLVAKGGGRVLRGTDPASVAQAVLAAIEAPERLASMARKARETARRYTLESWQREIRRRLEDAWGPLEPTAPKRDPAVSLTGS